MNTNEYIVKNRVFKGRNHDKLTVFPAMNFRDGCSLSVQVSSSHYCYPKMDYTNYYWKVEIAYPFGFSLSSEFEKYQDGDSGVYGMVPVELVDALIEAHGGIVGQI